MIQLTFYNNGERAAVESYLVKVQPKSKLITVIHENMAIEEK